jgi:hypothetical protein
LLSDEEAENFHLFLWSMPFLGAFSFFVSNNPSSFHSILRKCVIWRTQQTTSPRHTLLYCRQLPQGTLLYCRQLPQGTLLYCRQLPQGTHFSTADLLSNRRKEVFTLPLLLVEV